MTREERRDMRRAIEDMCLERVYALLKDEKTSGGDLIKAIALYADHLRGDAEAPEAQGDMTVRFTEEEM